MTMSLTTGALDISVVGFLVGAMILVPSVWVIENLTRILSLSVASSSASTSKRYCMTLGVLRVLSDLTFSQLSITLLAINASIHNPCIVVKSWNHLLSGTPVFISQFSYSPKCWVWIGRWWIFANRRHAQKSSYGMDCCSLLRQLWARTI